MAISAEPRVALYFDFDNIVISRYDQLHGDLAYRKDTARGKAPTASTVKKLAEATVDIDAVLDFAATFGTIAIARAYADWSTPINASYRGQLIDRAVDLVQLFPLSATKNGADIRLAVDAVEDMFRIEDLTHIVIVAGDSDYVALAQKCKRLGRYVVGIGVAGGTSRALTASCDQFADYDALLSTDASVADDEAGVETPRVVAAAESPTPPASEASAEPAVTQPPRSRRASRPARKPADATVDAGPVEPAAEPAPTERAPALAVFMAPGESGDDADAASATGTRNPGRLLLKAMELLRAKNDQEWQASGAVKNQMMRMDPSFQERRLGFGSFTDFVKSRAGVVELDEAGGSNRIRIRPKKD